MTAGQIAPEDGAVKEQQPPTAVSFLDPALKGVWRRVLFLWSRTCEEPEFEMIRYLG